MDKIYQLRMKHAAALDELETLYDNAKAFDAKAAEITTLAEQIKRAEKAQNMARSMAKPTGGPDGADDPNKFKSLGDQLNAIARYYAGGAQDPRLVRAPFGSGETDPASGGFLVDIDFANTILSRAYDMGEILRRVFKLTISANSNGIKIPGVDEQSRATGSRWGGVQSYWVGEGDPANQTRPRFRIIELDLKKLMATWVITDELLADQNALTGIANQAFSEEIMFMTEDSIIRGTGAGMPQGILGATATVTVAAENGQAPGTFLWENALKMWANMWARSRQNAVWLINQEIEPQLYQLRQVVGTGGQPVYLPQGGASGAPYATLLGRPVIATEYNEAPGTPGDVMLVDLTQYVLADKNAMQQMSSIHVRFLTDEMTFRLTYRLDGQPIWHTPLQPYRGAMLRSPFVVLAGR